MRKVLTTDLILLMVERLFRLSVFFTLGKLYFLSSFFYPHSMSTLEDVL